MCGCVCCVVLCQLPWFCRATQRQLRGCFFCFGGLGRLTGTDVFGGSSPTRLRSLSSAVSWPPPAFHALTHYFLTPPNAHIMSLSSIFLLLFYLVLKCSLISFPSFPLDSQPLSFPSVLFLFSWRAEDPSTHTHCAAVTTLPASTFSFCYLHFY